MKHLRILCLFLAFLLLFTSSLADSLPAETGVVADSNHVKLLGRTWLKEDVLWCAMSGTGIEFVYHGSDLTLRFLGDSAVISEGNRARVGIYVDDVRTQDFLLKAKETTVPVYRGRKRRSPSE